MRFDLKKRLFLSFSLVILALGLLTVLIGTYLISTSTVQEFRSCV